MLSQIRDRATGWIAWFIVILISIPFALWGVNEYFAGGANVVVAVVNGDEIEQDTYRYALDDRRDALRRMLGQNFDPELVNSDEFKRSVLDDLIRRNLLSIDAAERGYRVSDAQLADFIRTMPQFQRDGAFDQETYERAVAGYGYTKTGFEAQLRQQSVLQQLRDGFQQSAFVTDADRERMLVLARQERKVEYTELTADRFIDEVEVSEQEIKDEYENGDDLYQEPERMKVQYVRLAVADLSEGVEPGEEELRRAYDENRARFVDPEERRASHILIKLPSDSDEAAREAALARAQELADKARAGEDFAELAKANSEDPGSAAAGGDLGVIAPGVMVAPFEQAVLKLAAGEVSDPVETRFGYHVIKLTSLVPERVQPFDEVRAELEREERRRQAESLFLDRAELFRNLAFEQPETLEPLAEELDLAIETSDWFNREEGGGIAASPRVRNAAFADDVLVENLNSEAIELDTNSLVVLRKLEHETARRKPLDAVRDEIVARIKQRKALAKVEEAGVQMLDRLQSDGDWLELIEERQLERQEATLRRSDFASVPGKQVVDAVFRMPPPAAGQAGYGGVKRNDGAFVLFRLTAIEQGEVDEQVTQRMAEALDRRRGIDYYLSYQEGLRESADVVVFDDQL